MTEHLYVEVDDLKARLGVDDRYVRVLTSAVVAASRAIDGHCGRRFWADTDATARQYRPTGACGGDVIVDDISTTDALVIAYGSDGTYGTTVAGTSYELEPANGVGPDGNTGWPYEMIRLVESSFPSSRSRRTVQITAKWGWLEVPAAVQEACRLLAADLYHYKDVKFGIAGVNDFGPLRIGDNRTAANLLAIYRRATAFLAVG